VVATKADLGPSPGDWLRVSAKTGEGVPELIERISLELRGRRALESPADSIPGVQDI